MDLGELTGKLLGQGMSGAFFLEHDIGGNQFVRKVFHGSLITNVIHYLSSGAPNPYIWNENAIQSAYYRRKILSDLVEYWFEGRLRVAEARGVSWNADHRAYELTTEFINGRHAALHHSFSRPNESELSDLVTEVMNPLQERLAESGFDGLVWQAGKGNPVAANNFMLEKNPSGGNNWVWIDLESGVPALFPLNPISLLSFYLPKSFRHGRALFDDVDVPKLASYVLDNGSELEKSLGIGRTNALRDNILQLNQVQLDWKSLGRADRGIQHSLKKEKITEAQATRYSNNHAAWYGREAVRIAGKASIKLVMDMPFAALDRLSLGMYQLFSLEPWKLAYSQDYRRELLRGYVGNRIDGWERRKQLSANEAAYLRRQLEHEAASPYLTDLAFHVGLKSVEPFVGGAIATALYLNGSVDLKTSGMIAFLGGSITRTAYTGLRMADDAMVSFDAGKIASGLREFFVMTHYLNHFEGLQESASYVSSKVLGVKRLIALALGAVPTYGNAAYPVQMLYSGTTATRDLAKFLMYDGSSRIGENVPIWGGKDTMTEHFFNRIPGVLVRNREPL